MAGDQLSLRVDNQTTQTRRFKSLIGEFLRLEFKRVEPQYGPYEISINIERAPRRNPADVDHVAKAVLDALSGIVFDKNSQVERLLVNKIDGRKAKVSVTARPMTPLQSVDAEVIKPRRARVLEDA